VLPHPVGSNNFNVSHSTKCPQIRKAVAEVTDNSCLINKHHIWRFHSSGIWGSINWWSDFHDPIFKGWPWKRGHYVASNTGVQLSSNAATYPRIMRSSSTLLQKPQNSQWLCISQTGS